MIPAEYFLNKKVTTRTENGGERVTGTRRPPPPPTVCTNADSPVGNTHQRASGGGDASQATSKASPGCLSFQQGDSDSSCSWPVSSDYQLHSTTSPMSPDPRCHNYIFYQMLAEPEGVASLCAHLVMTVEFSSTALEKNRLIRNLRSSKDCFVSNKAELTIQRHHKTVQPHCFLLSSALHE